MKLWILVFMFTGQPMASGPHELEVCLSMAQQQSLRSGFKAHCYNPETIKRRYPVAGVDYLPVPK